MKRGKVVIAFVVGIVLTSMTVHDILPYSDR